MMSPVNQVRLSTLTSQRAAVLSVVTILKADKFWYVSEYVCCEGSGHSSRLLSGKCFVASD